MLVSIFGGFVVDFVVILSTAKPSELSSRCGAVPFVPFWLSVFAWPLGWYLEPNMSPTWTSKPIQNAAKSRKKNDTETNRKKDAFLSRCWNRFFMDFLGFGVPTRGSRADPRTDFFGVMLALGPRWPQTPPRGLRAPIMYPLWLIFHRFCSSIPRHSGGLAAGNWILHIVQYSIVKHLSVLVKVCYSAATGLM